VLARYLDRAPATLRFDYGPRGKPLLPGTPLSFNLSHSADRALLAVTREARLGVDIERIRPVDHERIARRFFAPAEAARLAALPERRRAAAFFAGWTRKEAFMKAVGEGLSLPLDSFEVSLDGPAVLLRAAAGVATDWSLLELHVPEGFTAALALEGRLGRIRCYAEPTGT
jgi:4'-phosphopantetheinyl transferase